MPKHATITPAVIKHLMTKPEMLEQFPFLRFAKRASEAKVGRSCCGKARRSGRTPTKAYETVMASIAHLPPDRLAIIKKALGADTLTVTVSVGSKTVVHNR